MEAIKELDQAIVDNYATVFQPAVKTVPPKHRQSLITPEVEGSKAAVGIFHAILFAIPLWALIIYSLIKLVG